MQTAPLFDAPSLPRETVKRLPTTKATARVLEPNRKQLELRPVDLESLLPQGHRARIVWGFGCSRQWKVLAVPVVWSS